MLNVQVALHFSWYILLPFQQIAFIHYLGFDQFVEKSTNLFVHVRHTGRPDQYVYLL